MDRAFVRTEGRCKDCTLDLRLKRLQVLRLLVPAEGRDVCDAQKEGSCTLSEDKRD